MLRNSWTETQRVTFGKFRKTENYEIKFMRVCVSDDDDVEGIEQQLKLRKTRVFFSIQSEKTFWSETEAE